MGTDDPARGGSNILDFASHRGGAIVPATCIGRLVDWTDGGPCVDYPGNPHGPLPALSLVAWKPDQVAELIANASPIVLGFEQGRADRPIILGAPIQTGRAPAPARPPSTEVVVDGETISIQGDKEVELRCGKASITLTHSGKIVIRGTEIVSRSTGANRILGGSVELN